MMKLLKIDAGDRYLYQWLIDDRFLKNHEHEEPRKSQLFSSDWEAWDARNNGKLDIS